MRRMAGVLCVLCIVCITISGYSAEVSENVKYNYKLSFEDESEFTNKYGWASAHPENPNFPDSMKPTGSVVSDGRFGSAYQIVNPFFYCDNYYGITWRFELKQIISPMAGAAAERLLDYMMQVQSVNYWVKIPYSETVENNVAANTRRTRMTLEAQVADPTPENPQKLKSMSFRADVRLPNTGEWQYVQIPISCFKAGGLPITDYYDRIQRYRYLDIEAFNDKSFFGELPSAPVLNSDGTIETPAESWNDRSKDVPILIDEMVFDRSTKETPAYTKPSPGEESNLANSALRAVYVKGEEVSILRVEGSNEITVPLSHSITYLAEADVECIPEVATVVSDLDAEAPIISAGAEQIRVGASCNFIPPTHIPGTGKLLITAGDGVACSRYNLNFVHREGVYAGVPEISGLSANGNIVTGKLRIRIPLFNAEEDTGSAVICAVVTDTASGAVKAVEIQHIGEIVNGQPIDANLELDITAQETNSFMLKLFLFDDIMQMHMITEPFAYGNTTE